MLRKRFRVLPKSFRMLRKRFRVLRKSFRMLRKRFRMLRKSFRMLRKRFRMLRKPFRTLRKSFRMLRKPFLRFRRRSGGSGNGSAASERVPEAPETVLARRKSFRSSGNRFGAPEVPAGRWLPSYTDGGLRRAGWEVPAPKGRRHIAWGESPRFA